MKEVGTSLYSMDSWLGRSLGSKNTASQVVEYTGTLYVMQRSFSISSRKEFVVELLLLWRIQENTY